MSQSVPAGADPRLFCNGQYLFEDDPDNAAECSKAAQQAQKEKLMDDRGSRKKLPRELMARNGAKPQLYHYGIPFTDHYMLEYAKRHHLTLKLCPETSELFGGKLEFDFADICKHGQHPELMNDLLSAASFLAARHIESRCGISLHVARLFSLVWDGMLSLWSNYDMDERHSKLDIVAKLEEAMHKSGQENDIEWWYEWDNPVSLLSSVA